MTRCGGGGKCGGGGRCGGAWEGEDGVDQVLCMGGRGGHFMHDSLADRKGQKL